MCRVADRGCRHCFLFGCKIGCGLELGYMKRCEDVDFNGLVCVIVIAALSASYVHSGRGEYKYRQTLYSVCRSLAW